jgi:drug/metabolite transporter (DMT)-like permease
MTRNTGVAAPARPPSRLQLILAFAATYAFWGASFLAIRIAVRDIPPLLMMAVRCAAGATILLCFLVARGGLERPTRRQVLTTLAAGLLCFLGCHGLLAGAERRVTSGEAALYSSTTPLFVVLLDALRRRLAPSAREVAGILLGIASVAVLVGSSASSGRVLDRVVIVLGSLFWAAGSLVARSGPPLRRSGQSTAMQLGGGAVALFVASGLAGELSHGWSLADVGPSSLLALAFLIICATVLAFGAYTWLLRVTTPAAASTYAFANPVVALLLSSLVGDGSLMMRGAFAGAFIILAIALTRPKTSEGAGAGPVRPSLVRASKDVFV